MSACRAGGPLPVPHITIQPPPLLALPLSHPLSPSSHLPNLPIRLAHPPDQHPFFPRDLEEVEVDPVSDTQSWSGSLFQPWCLGSHLTERIKRASKTSLAEPGVSSLRWDKNTEQVWPSRTRIQAHCSDQRYRLHLRSADGLGFGEGKRNVTLDQRLETSD